MTTKKYEEIKKCNFYKKRLGKSIHLCTIYGLAKDKTAPLWKRILSHIYIIVFFKVEDDKPRERMS
jgi:hypothetical protein